MLYIFLLLLLLLQALLLVSAQSCTDNPLVTTTAHQVLTLYTNLYTLSASLQCGVDGTRTAVYTSFTPPLSGAYYVRVPSTSEDLIMEIRAGAMCNGAYLNCNGDLDGTWTKTGFNAIALVGGQTYVILISHFSYSGPSYSVQLEVGLVAKMPVLTSTPVSQPNCTDNPLVSTTAPQTRTLETNVHLPMTYMTCMRVTRNATYVSFTPPSSGTYYVRASSSALEDLAMEIRAGPMCEGAILECNDRLDRNITKAGFNFIALTENHIYVILIFPDAYMALRNSSLIEVGLVSSNATFLDALAHPFLIMIIVLCVIFGLALLIAIAFCCRDGRVKHNQKDVAVPGCCGTSSLAKIRKLAIATCLLSILVCATTWTVYWSASAYLLALITLILGANILRAAYSPNFVQTRVAENASWYKDTLEICGLMYFFHTALAGTHAFFLSRDNATLCYPMRSISSTVDFDRCLDLLSVFVVYGIVAASSMFVLIIVTCALGRSVLEVASKMIHNSRRNGGNGAVEDAYDDGGIALPPPAYPQAEVDSEEYPQAELVVDYPQAEVVVDHPQAEIAQQKQKRQWGFEVLREYLHQV